MSKKNQVSVLVSIIFFFIFNSFAVGVEFPFRKKYSDVPVIEIEDLYQKLDQVLVVDVRSTYEFETIHVKGAINIPVANLVFISRLKKAIKSDPKPVVFYCNGITCQKSYKACRKAIESGVKDAYAFDLGIFNWTKKHPKNSVLLGETPVNLSNLISSEKFKARLIEPKAFVEKIDKNAFVIDIRESFQQKQKILKKVSRNVPLDRITSMIDRGKRENKTLLIYDAVGKQVKWLQYRLEKEGMTDYYFMKGGVKQYLAHGFK